MVVFEMCSSKNGVAAREIERKYGKTAWFMLHRIREAMKAGPLADMMRGVVVDDETFMGGSFKNKHKGARKDYTAGRASGPYDKTPVLSLVSTDTGEVRLQVLDRVDGSNLRKAIAEHVDLPNATLHTRQGSVIQRRRPRGRSASHRRPQGRRVRPPRAARRRHDEPRGRVLLAVEAVNRRNAPLGQPRAPAPPPRRGRFPVLHPRDR
jgi:hypothetical protein